MGRFRKRSYNFRLLGRDIVNIIRFRKFVKNPSLVLGDKFVRHIMLASTAVNGCRYCAWGHTYSGINSNDDYQLLAGILNQSFEQVPVDEHPALKFAMAYAEREGKYTQNDLFALRKHYGKKSAAIILTVMMINIGNLSGNTIDAFESRLRGNPPENGSILLEFIFYFFGGRIFKDIMERNPVYQRLLKDQLIHI